MKIIDAHNHPDWHGKDFSRFLQDMDEKKNHVRQATDRGLFEEATKQQAQVTFRLSNPLP
mgnify:CR=1 FL=1